MPTTPRVPHQTPMYDTGSGADGFAKQVAEALKQLKMSRTWIIFFERLGNWLDITNNLSAGELKATFGINRELNADDVSLTFQPFIAKDFADARPFRLLRVVAYAPPSGSTARMNIDISKDEGASWYSILDTGGSGYFELAADDATRQDFADIFRTDEYGSIEDGDLLRINCSQVGSSYPGKNIEFVLWFDEAP